MEFHPWSNKLIIYHQISSICTNCINNLMIDYELMWPRMKFHGLSVWIWQ